tara:strand:- start:37 stop:204 length:168 start_codon:yes stop_codon:yes gene_type:complete
MVRKHSKKYKPKKLRNPEKFLMDRYYHPKVFRSKRVGLKARDADQQVKDFYEGEV